MKRTFQLFWQKSWDNLLHLVAFNFIWFVLSLPLLVSVYVTVRSLAVAEAGGALPPVAVESVESDAAGATGAEDMGRTEELIVVGGGGLAQYMTPMVMMSLVFMALSWVVFCVATGFVFHGMADIVPEYDFSGYKHVVRKYHRRGPVLRSVGLMTLFAATSVATLVNLYVYLVLATSKAAVFLLLAGIMIWFGLLVLMAFPLAMALSAQRGTGIWGSIRSGASLSLSSPGRMFVVGTMAVLVTLVAVISGAGAGFFMMAAPAALYNAAARAFIEELEAKTQAEGETQDETG